MLIEPETFAYKAPLAAECNPRRQAITSRLHSIKASQIKRC